MLWDRARSHLATGIKIESREHPEIPQYMIKSIVLDHLREDPRYYEVKR
jgi:hypothetical protein